MVRRSTLSARGGSTHRSHARRCCHRDDSDCATPNGCARSVHQSDQDSRSSSRARVIQIRNDLAPKDANRRSTRLAEINNTRVGEATVLGAVYFESNNAESEEVATMPIEARGCTQNLLLSDQERNQVGGLSANWKLASPAVTKP